MENTFKYFPVKTGYFCEVLAMFNNIDRETCKDSSHGENNFEQ